MKNVLIDIPRSASLSLSRVQEMLVHWPVLQKHLEVSYPAPDCSLRQNLGVRERQLATVELNSLSGFSEKTFLVVNKTMTIMLCWSLLISVVCLQETPK